MWTARTKASSLVGLQSAQQRPTHLHLSDGVIVSTIRDASGGKENVISLLFSVEETTNAGKFTSKH